MRLFSQTSTNTERGFTIVEVMISMAIFTVLVTIGIGSVLAAVQQHHVAENTRTVMDNLNFVMEDMATNIRLGTNIRCMASGEPPLTVTSDTEPITPQDCPLPSDAHNEIVFNDQDGNVLSYDISSGRSFLDVTTGLMSGTPSQIFKQKGTAAPELISPPGVSMNFAQSGFTVRGSLPGDGGQPTVTIRLSGTATYEGVNSAFALETTVTLRNLDS